MKEEEEEEEVEEEKDICWRQSPILLSQLSGHHGAGFISSQLKLPEDEVENSEESSHSRLSKDPDG